MTIVRQSSNHVLRREIASSDDLWYRRRFDVVLTTLQAHCEGARGHGEVKSQYKRLGLGLRVAFACLAD